MPLTLPPTRKRSLIIAGFLLAYLAAYLFARYTHTLVHRVSFATESATRVQFHKVTAGDCGLGLLQKRSSRFLIPVSYIAFTPCRWAESLLWQIIPRNYDL